ncbi:MAG: hypothetical protein ACJ72P_07725 [Nocardioides sp.]
MLVGVAEIAAIAGRAVSIARAQLAVPGGQRTVGTCFFAAVPHVSGPLPLLGLPVSLLGAQITLLRTFEEDLDAGIGLHGIHLAQDRLLVALPLVGLRVLPVGATVPLAGLPVSSVGLPVSSVGFAVAAVGFAVEAIRRQVPLSVGVALLGSLGALGRNPVSLLGGALSFQSGLVAQVGTLPASFGHLLTLLR